MILSAIEETENTEKRGRESHVWRRVGIVKLYPEVMESTCALHYAGHWT